MFMEFTEESGMDFDPKPAKYGIRFAMADDENRSITLTEGGKTEAPQLPIDCKYLFDLSLSVLVTLCVVWI